MMTQKKIAPLARRAALLGGLSVLPGCSLWDDWFGSSKTPLPGKREPVLAVRHGLEVDKATARPVTLPAPAPVADWPQSGGLPSHDMEHPALPSAVAEAWSRGIGSGGGYRRKILAQPLIVDGRVFTMDSGAIVTARDAASGSEIWSFDTEDEDNRSTNVGGGIAVSGGKVFATTGRGDLVAIDASNGSMVWRQVIGTAARSSPTVAEDKIFFCTIDSKVLAHAVADGKRIWSYQGTSTDASVLGIPAPAYEGGLVVAGLGTGELVALRGASGTVAWGDSLAAARGRNSMADLSAVRGRPAIRDGRVYAASLGGLLVALDLRSGRRLWEREVASSESPWVAGDWIFLVSTDGQVAAIARQDGAVAWLTQLDRFENMEKSRDPIQWVGPVLAGNRLVVMGTNKLALAISPYTGEVIGQQDLPGKAAVAPSVAGGTLYILTDDATLSAFR